MDPMGYIPNQARSRMMKAEMDWNGASHGKSAHGSHCEPTKNPRIFIWFSNAQHHIDTELQHVTPTLHDEIPLLVLSKSNVGWLYQTLHHLHPVSLPFNKTRFYCFSWFKRGLTKLSSSNKKRRLLKKKQKQKQARTVWCPAMWNIGRRFQSYNVVNPMPSTILLIMTAGRFTNIIQVIVGAYPMPYTPIGDGWFMLMHWL